MKIANLMVVFMCLLTPFAHAELDISEWRGEWRQGGLIWGYLPQGVTLRLDGAPVDQAQDGLFVFGFGRDAAAEATLTLLRNDDLIATTTVNVAPQDYRIQRVEGVPQRTVTPSEEDQERIRREAALVNAARAQSIPEGLFIEPFIWPTQGPITGVFGSQRVYNGVPGRPHFGVDVGVPKGTPVSAPARGVIVLAEPDLFYSGGTVIIDHGMGVSSSMLHLSRVDVQVGQRVAQGEKIGEVGATGRATGPHLDWRMNWRNTRIDPYLIVGPMPDKQPKR
ncbi:MAG TPA: M23 family metallopeptidase [Pseudomonadales bacterium]|nr:M23 family metallopeptidase [Pseudomonadales bacterium]